MAIADDISVAASGDIRYTGDAHGGVAPGYYTVLEFYRFLMDLADNAAEAGDDLMSIVRSEPAERSTDNIISLLGVYNIDDTLAEHLYDGSISQGGGMCVYSGLEVVGAVESGTVPMVVQNNTLLTAYWGAGLNADPSRNIIMRILVKTRMGGADIDGKRVRVMAREFGDTYAEFSVTMGLGSSVAALFTSNDLNNETAAGTVAGWNSIVNVEGYQLVDLQNGNGPQPYYAQWDKGDQSINQLYERTKWLQRRGSSSTLYGIDGQLFRGVTHQWAYDGEANGPFVEGEVIGWGSSTALLLALKDDGATGTMWVQLLTGVAPSNDVAIAGVTSGATCAVNGAATSRQVSPQFFGQSTGSAIIGAFGIGVDPADLTASDKLFDLTNTQQTPPNQQTYTVSGLVAGEDYVTVAQNDGFDEIKYDQLTLDGGYTMMDSQISVAQDIPIDTPATGVVRAFNGTSYVRLPYTSWAGKTFTLANTLPAPLTNGVNVYIAYIDQVAAGGTAAFTYIYAADRSVIIKVRDGGATPIKPFKSPGTMTSTGGSVAAIRQADV